MPIPFSPMSRRRLIAYGTKAIGLAFVSRFAIGSAGADTMVRIGIQKGGSLFLLRARGDLDPALRPLGVVASCTEFPGGPQLLEALNVGSIDFGEVGEAPPIFAQAAGAPLLYVAARPPAPESEAILVSRDSPIRSVAALKGKRVVLNRGSNVHYFLVQALRAAGLDFGDVTPVYLPPSDARAAFERGSVDAWVIWDPFLTAESESGDARVLTDAKGLAPNRGFNLASRRLAESRPDIVRALLEAADRIDHWTSDNISEAAKLLAPSMGGLPTAIIETTLRRRGYGVVPMTPEIVADQQKIADTFTKLHLIPKPIDVASAVWRQQS